MFNQRLVTFTKLLHQYLSKLLAQLLIPAFHQSSCPVMSKSCLFHPQLHLHKKYLPISKSICYNLSLLLPIQPDHHLLWMTIICSPSTSTSSIYLHREVRVIALLIKILPKPTQINLIFTMAHNHHRFLTLLQC